MTLKIYKIVNKSLSQNVTKMRAEHEMFRPHKSFKKVIDYLPLTTSLNFLPAEKTGTVLAGILISLPV